MSVAFCWFVYEASDSDAVVCWVCRIVFAMSDSNGTVKGHGADWSVEMSKCPGTGVVSAGTDGETCVSGSCLDGMFRVAVAEVFDFGCCVVYLSSVSYDVVAVILGDHWYWA